MDISSIKNIQIVEKIGSGPSGTVYKAWDKTQQRQKAIKILDRETYEKVIRPHLGAMRKLSKIDHPNLTGSIEIIEDSQNPAIVSDFIEGKNLVEIIEEDIKIKLSPFDILKQITVALNELDRHQLIHGNLKLSNILITDDQRVVLTDPYLSQLGLALDDDQIELSADEYFYLAPEQVLESKQTIKSDFYATGVVIYRLITSEFPYGAFNKEGIINAIEGQVPDFNRLLDFKITGIQKLFIQRLLDKDPAGRFINCAEILNTLKEIKHYEDNAVEQPALNPDNSNPRPYLMVSILIALVFIFWLVVSGYSQ